MEMYGSFKVYGLFCIKHVGFAWALTLSNFIWTKMDFSFFLLKLKRIQFLLKNCWIFCSHVEIDFSIAPEFNKKKINRIIMYTTEIVIEIAFIIDHLFASDSFNLIIYLYFFVISNELLVINNPLVSSINIVKCQLMKFSCSNWPIFQTKLCPNRVTPKSPGLPMRIFQRSQKNLLRAFLC